VRNFLTAAVLTAAMLAPASAQAAASATIFFPQTSHSVSLGFKQFFDTRGSLEVFGYPTTEEIRENGWTVQYFQRARFEYHPELAGTPYAVELGLLGDLTAGQTFDKANPQPGARFYRETSHNLSGAFQKFFDTRGGLDIFGYPTSEPFDRGGFTVQYFQRARLELHGSDVMLGLVGDEYVANQRAAAAAAPPTSQASSGPTLADVSQLTPPSSLPLIVAAPQPQPIIRTAVFGGSSVKVTGNGSFTAGDATGRQLASVPAGQTATVTASGPTNYTLNVAGQNIASSIPIRFTAAGGAILSDPDLPAYARDFRGVLEANFSAKSNKLWLIDELPLEDYVKGIGEEPEGLTSEAYKALSVAYRTYGLSTLQRHRADSGWGEPFDLGSSTEWVAPYNGANQIFSGYHRETIGPLLSQGADATAGQVVTYNGAVVVTPYYSHSDGHTRGWAEIWHGNDHPWLISVADPDSNGMALLGHGVGMPLQSAIKRAAAGWGYDQVLRYFYTGVRLTKLY
jgi:peptidoglycan hydrolase-like amidase